MGIILNMIAGILMALDFFIKREWVDRLNNWLKEIVDIMQDKVSVMHANFIIIIFLLLPIEIIILPVYISNFTNTSLRHGMAYLVTILMVFFVLDQLFIKPIIRYFYLNKKESVQIFAETKLKPRVTDHKGRSSPFRENSLKFLNYVKIMDISTITFLFISISMILYSFSSNIGFSNLVFISKIIFSLSIALMGISLTAFLILRAITLSEKGVIGSIGVVLYIMGNAFQLWATFL